MGHMITLVPTRSRPDNLARLLDTWERNSFVSDILIGVDRDDPEAKQYQLVLTQRGSGALLAKAQIMWFPEHKMLGPKLNDMLYHALSMGSRPVKGRHYCQPYTVIGFMGDDHVPTQGGWDLKFSNLDNTGAAGRQVPFLAYGNDRHQGANLPTAIWGSRNVWQELGWMYPLGLEHLYGDNVWKALGDGAGILRYFPDLIIEHRHPYAHKAPMDRQYAQVNSPAQYSRDIRVYKEFMESAGIDGFRQSLNRILRLKSASPTATL